MKKGETRPYIILLIEIEKNKFVIPIRTNLHKTRDCYESNPQTNSGLDYTKAVVISRNDYIDSTRFPENPRFRYCALQYFKNELGLEYPPPKKSYLFERKRNIFTRSPEPDRHLRRHGAPKLTRSGNER